MKKRKGNRTGILIIISLLALTSVGFVATGIDEGTYQVLDTTMVTPDMVSLTGSSDADLTIDSDPMAMVVADAITLDVPLIRQLPELPTGCEVVSATMLLQYYEIAVDKIQTAEALPLSSNPALGFVGSPFLSSGYTIDPEPLALALSPWMDELVGVQGMTMEELKEALSSGNPVVVWLEGFHGFTIHAVTVTGYDGDSIRINDPWTGEKNATLETDHFISMWVALGNKALYANF